MGQFVCVDESASNRKVLNRRVGASKKGTRAKSKRFFFHRGKAYSVLGPFTMDDGFINISVVEGGFDTERFLAVLEQKVPILRPYPEDHSVLLLDNCPIHKKKAVLDMVAKQGAIVLFLTPYDPDSMPIEVGFRAMKGWLRSN